VIVLVLTLSFAYFGPKVAGLYTVAVGIGKDINTDVLRDIAGPNGSVIVTESFDQLASKLDEIKKKVCGKF